MAISVFPAASSSSVTAQAVSTTTANVQKTVIQTFNPGVYQISVSPSSSIAIVQFISGSTWIGQTTTSSGTINYNLATAADRIYVQSNNVGDVVTVNLTASVPVANSISGTLDTITSSGTYSQTGLLWVLAIGGGGGGGGARNGYGSGGGGGATGAMSMYFGNVSSSTSVTIGTGGAGGAIQGLGTAGGTTSFGTYAVAIGGEGGNWPGGPGGGVSVPSGTSSGTVVVPSSGGVLTNIFRAIKDGTTGGGGNGAAGGGNGTPTAGVGSGIGTGGSSSVGAAGGNGTGYGSGGGGGSCNGSANSPQPGGNGAPGVVYVLRGF